MARLPPSTIRIRFECSISNFWPFFLHEIIGSGLPRGPAHSSRAVSPCATRVFCGSRRNSSLRTVKQRNNVNKPHVELALYSHFNFEYNLKSNFIERTFLNRYSKNNNGLKPIYYYYCYYSQPPSHLNYMATLFNSRNAMFL